MFRRDFISSMFGALALPFAKAKPAEPECGYHAHFECEYPTCNGCDCLDGIEYEVSECGPCECDPEFTIIDRDGNVVGIIDRFGNVVGISDELMCDSFGYHLAHKEL